jgi:hypothetical protein
MHSEGGEKSAIEMHDGRGAWEDFFLGRQIENPGGPRIPCVIIRI